MGSHHAHPLQPSFDWCVMKRDEDERVKCVCVCGAVGWGVCRIYSENLAGLERCVLYVRDHRITTAFVCHGVVPYKVIFLGLVF